MQGRNQVLVYFGGLALLHRLEALLKEGFPEDLHMIFYIRKHWTQRADQRFKDLKWGQRSEDFPIHSRRRMERILDSLGPNFDDYIPVWALKRWSDELMAEVMKIKKNNFECHFSDAFEVEDDKAKKTFSISYQNGPHKHAKTYQIGGNTHLIEGMCFPRNPSHKFRTVNLTAESLLKKNRFPKNNPFKAMTYTLVGYGESGMMCAEHIIEEKGRIRFLNLDINKLPTNERYESTVKKIKSNPASFRIPDNHQLFSYESVMRSKPKDAKFPYKKAIEQELVKQGLLSVHGFEKLWAIFVYNAQTKSFVFQEFTRVVLNIGYEAVELFDESVQNSHSYEMGKDETEENVVSENAQGSVLHHYLKIDYIERKIQRKRYQPTEVSKEGFIYYKDKETLIEEAKKNGVGEVDTLFFKIYKAQLRKMYRLNKRRLERHLLVGVLIKSFGKRLKYSSPKFIRSRLPFFRKFFAV
jgi:hypothetical protein